MGELATPTDSVISYFPLPTLSFGVFGFYHGTGAGPPTEFIGGEGGLTTFYTGTFTFLRPL